MPPSGAQRPPPTAMPVLIGSKYARAVGAVPRFVEIETRGPYAFVRHPNYLVVRVALLALPLAFGLSRSAAIAAIVNVGLLALPHPRRGTPAQGAAGLPPAFSGQAALRAVSTAALGAGAIVFAYWDPRLFERDGFFGILAVSSAGLALLFLSAICRRIAMGSTRSFTAG